MQVGFHPRDRFNREGRPVRVINVDKSELIEKLTTNRTKHAQEFQAALVGWSQTVLVALDEARAEFVATGSTEKLNVSYDHARPISHVEDYDRALEMLQWETASTVSLTEDDFRSLVQDKWGWTNNFKMSTSKYS